MPPDQQLGEFGEQEVKARLERAICGHGFQFQGFADKGLDLLMQFLSPSPGNQPLHFCVQVKTGDSFAESARSHWKIKNIPEDRFKQWTKSKLPVVFVWVRPAEEAECFWSIIRANTSRSHFLVSKKSIITPSLRFELALEYGLNKPEPQTKTIRLLRPPLRLGLRPFAKDYYRNELMKNQPIHPILGPVTFSWHGWRHLTRLGRSQSYIQQSLHFLSAATLAIEKPHELTGVRRMPTTVRGSWITETRLLAFKCRGVEMASRPAADVIVVLRERIVYPTNWQGDVYLHKKIKREVVFESIYEKFTIR